MPTCGKGGSHRRRAIKEGNKSAVSAACFFQLSRWMRSQQQHLSMRLWLLALTTVTPYWPGRRRSQQTSCSVWWMLPASLATFGSSKAAYRGYCTTYSTASMSPTEYNSSSSCWCIDVFMEQFRCTDEQLHTNSRYRRSSTSAVRGQSAEDDRSALSTGQLWSSVFCCCRPVDMEFAVRQSLWLSSESQHIHALSENSLFAKYWRDVRSALEIFLHENALCTLCSKNTHSHFLSYLHEWSVDLNKNYSEHT